MARTTWEDLKAARAGDSAVEAAYAAAKLAFELGEQVRGMREERGWSQAVFAQRMDYSRKHINLLLKGKVSITDETAIKLSSVLGSSPRFWLNLEAQYREHLAQREAEKN